jgi:hypothetical protein
MVRKQKSFPDLAQIAFWADQMSEYEFAGQIDPLKHCSVDLEQVSFWVVQKADNKFAGPVDPLKHSFLDFAQVSFWASKMQNICSEC